MKNRTIIDIPKITRTAILEVPKTWQSINKTYLHPITKKDVFRLNFLAILVGIAVGYASLGFRFLIGLFQNLFLHHQFDWHLISPLDHKRGLWMFAILPAGLFASSALIRIFAKEAQGHGIPEVIEAIRLKGGRMRARSVLVKAFSSSITIASGGSVGREGPVVQIGSAIGSVFGQVLSLDPKLIKTLVGCGASAAVAATFNTPIAAVIFAIEVIILELKTRSFVPLVIASVFGTIVSRIHLGNEPAFFVPKYSLHGPTELVFYFVLAVLAGILGVVFIKAVYGIEDYVEELKIPFWSKPLLGGLILAGVGMMFPEMFGVGYESISDVLQQKSSLEIMALFIVLKIICTSVCLACGGSGGVFVPSLFIGAMLGGAYGFAVNELFPDMTAGYGAYALVGMAAVFSSTARASFTAIVILFEMTLDYSIILPLMFVCVISDQVALAFMKHSIYSLKLKRKGLKFISDISVNVMSITVVKDIMTTQIRTASKNMSLAEARNKLLQYGHAVYPVVDDDNVLLGIISREEISTNVEKHPKMKISEFMQEAKAVVREDDSVLKAISKIEKSRDPRILVVSQRSRKLCGIVSPIDFVRLSSAEAE
ncbi:MAG: chloride channel protein [Bdellovibrionota bacterium]|nr:chloride channel protein [Bdellovibrionota bacterium]